MELASEGVQLVEEGECGGVPALFAGVACWGVYGLVGEAVAKVSEFGLEDSTVFGGCMIEVTGLEIEEGEDTANSVSANGVGIGFRFENFGTYKLN